MSAVRPSASFDHARRRRSRRAQRQRGCVVYIPAEDLIAAGFSPDDPPPLYQTWAAPHSKNTGRVIVSLYREP